jgi:hypothetical protein
MKLNDVDNMWVHDMEINVDMLKQSASVSKGHEIITFED